MKLMRDGNKKLIVCPFCGEIMCHIEQVKVNAGGDITIINSRGTKKSKGNPSGFGVLVEIQYYCELGHRWIEKQQFHKGVINVTMEKLQNYHPEYYPEKPDDYVSQDIWRD